MKYAFQLGVPIAILTDGRRWSFYLPGGSGTFQERRFYHLDLLERELGEIEERLQRYLSFDAVKTGNAFNAARTDYDDAVRARAVEEVLPRAWREMLLEGDTQLGQALSEKVSSLAGYQPKEGEITAFLWSQVPDDKSATNNGFHPAKKRAPIRSEPPTEPVASEAQELPFLATATNTSHDKGSWYSINGSERMRSKIAVEVTAAAFREAISLVPQLPELFEKEENHKRQGRKNQKRRWLARRKEELYSDPKFLPNSVEVAAGWWLGTHYSNNDKSEMLRVAQRIAAQHGVKLEFELG